MKENVILIQLLDAEIIKLYAEITHLKKEAKAWRNVDTTVYIKKN